MKTARQSKLFAGALAATLSAIVICATAIGSGAAEPTSAPAGQATTQEFTPDNISDVAIKLNYRQKVALSGVRDGANLYESAFYIMLARTEELADPEKAAKEYSKLEAPAFGHLTDHPNRYRAQKIRAVMRVHASRELVSGSKDWDQHPDWPKGKKVWYLAGYQLFANGANANPSREVLLVYSLVDPTELLGEPVETLPNGEQSYGKNSGKHIEIAGVFYKTYKQETVDSTPAERIYRDYPVVLAYYLKGTNKPPVSSTTSGSSTILVVIGVVMLGLLVMVRRQAKQAKTRPRGSTDGGVTYTPLRDVEDDLLPPDQRDDEPVNQDLVDAVKAYENKSK